MAVVAVAMLGCSDEQRSERMKGFYPEDASVASDSMLADVLGNDGPPSPDASGLCGNQFFEAAPEPPHLYFVLDRSGSMQDSAGGQHGWNKYTAVRVAVVDVVRKLGSRARFGAAVFPGEPTLMDGCAAGFEVFKTQRGDPPGGTSDGPVTKTFSKAIDVDPVGGTPTASTLDSLVPILASLGGKTVVILSTDGAPNCLFAECTASECIFNIEGQSIEGKKCVGDLNCCDPAVPGSPGPSWCVDAIYTTQAIQKLRDKGIRTFVVGIPGSSYYDALLDQMAIVGGSARPSSPRYFRVDDMEALSDTLMQIGNQVMLSCELVLDSAPPDPGFVNVYFDKKAVAYDETNGWTWTGDKTLTLHGDACEALEQGAVGQVQVVAGCPTTQPL